MSAANLGYRGAVFVHEGGREFTIGNVVRVGEEVVLGGGLVEMGTTDKDT